MPSHTFLLSPKWLQTYACPLSDPSLIWFRHLLPSESPHFSNYTISFISSLCLSVSIFPIRSVIVNSTLALPTIMLLRYGHLLLPSPITSFTCLEEIQLCKLLIVTSQNLTFTVMEIGTQIKLEVQQANCFLLTQNFQVESFLYFLPCISSSLHVNPPVYLTP